MKYTDQQRLNFLTGWDGWTDELRVTVDAAIEAQRKTMVDDVTSCCVECGVPVVPCDHGTCPGGKCPVCR